MLRLEGANQARVGALQVARSNARRHPQKPVGIARPLAQVLGEWLVTHGGDLESRAASASQFFACRLRCCATS